MKLVTNDLDTLLSVYQVRIMHPIYRYICFILTSIVISMNYRLSLSPEMR